MDFWIAGIFFYFCFSIIANIAYHSNQPSYEQPACFDELNVVFQDITEKKILNPFVILMAVSFVFFTNIKEFMKHLLFWWIIIPYQSFKG